MMNAVRELDFYFYKFLSDFYPQNEKRYFLLENVLNLFIVVVNLLWFVQLYL